VELGHLTSSAASSDHFLRCLSSIVAKFECPDFPTIVS